MRGDKKTVKPKFSHMVWSHTILTTVNEKRKNIQKKSKGWSKPSLEKKNGLQNWKKLHVFTN